MADEGKVVASVWYHRGLPNFDDDSSLCHLDDGTGTPINLVLATDYEALRKRCEAVEFELDCLRTQYEERTAYTIVHRGAALCCSSAMRDAYSDEHHRAERLASALNAPQSGNPCIECGADHGQPCTCPQGDQAIAAAKEPSHG